MTEAGFFQTSVSSTLSGNCNFREAVIELYEHSQQVSSTSGKGKLAEYVTYCLCVCVCSSFSQAYMFAAEAAGCIVYFRMLLQGVCRL